MSIPHQQKQHKCVVVGDSAIGKTCMVAYLAGKKPDMKTYVPTVFENTIIEHLYNGQQCRLELCDTAGQEEFDQIRIMSYSSVDVFLLCFSLVNKNSFENLQTVWLPELRKHQEKARIILVGTKLDLRKSSQHPSSHQNSIIQSDEIEALKTKLGFDYVECSSLTGEGIENVLNMTLSVAHRPDLVKKSKPRFGKGGKCALL